MIKYTCIKIKNKEKFQDTSEINIVVDTSDKTIDSLFPSKCPPSYHKIGDICCPVFLEKDKCPEPNSIDKTRYDGMPICALNYVAATKWTVDNNSEKVLNLCSNLPKTVPSVKRKQLSKVCDSNKELINDKCYTKCPEGFISNGNECIAKNITRDEYDPICPKNANLVNDNCLEKCPFGYKTYNNYCVPSNLADY